VRDMEKDYKFTIEEAAAYLGVSPRTMQNWRYESDKPKFYKPTNKLVYYFKSDLDKWIKENDTATD
jgi:DNA-binding transcriptional regulator YiaG